MENTIKAQVIECLPREYDGRKYYALVVSGINVPVGQVNAYKSSYKPGDQIILTFRRNKDFRLVAAVVE